MRKIIFFFGILISGLGAFAQKPEIDSNVFNHWPTLGGAVISDDGAYTAYTIDNEPGGNSLVIQRLPDGPELSFAGAGNCHFARNSDSAYFQSGDSLFVLGPGQLKPQLISVGACQFAGLRDDEWLTYMPKNKPGKMILVSLLDGKETAFDSVRNYSWSDRGKALLLMIQQGEGASLQWIDPDHPAGKEIWRTDVPFDRQNVSIRFGAQGREAAFLVRRGSANRQKTAIWFYGPGMPQAVKLADDSISRHAARLAINELKGFSEGGRYLIFDGRKTDSAGAKPIPGAAAVDVYSYRDATLQSQQLAEIKNERTYQAAVPVSGGGIVPLERAIDGDSHLFREGGGFAVVGEYYNKDFQPYWLTDNKSGAYNYYLVSLKDGSRKLLKQASVYPVSGFSFSPDGRWLVYWDSKAAAYIAYDLQTGREAVLGKGVVQLAATGDYVNMFGNSTCAQAIGDIRWLKDGNILSHDLYDLWRLDPSGKHPPVNLTNGYGSRHHISLRLLDEDDLNNAKVMLTGFNLINKENGFFEATLTKRADPRQLTMGPYDYYRDGSQLPSPRLSFDGELQPLKARNANVWIVERQTASLYPNYYYTRDWKQFMPITHLQPQKDYNWLTSELINYRQTDGTRSQGILYKPGNFDPKKKYPIIFNYYEHLSYRLYEFPQPDWTAHNINIPWFVAHGYLVFTPDNHYTVGSSKNGKTVGEAVLNSVEGAARYFMRLPYVDAHHMGLQGHSFGGGETNYLVTHSKLFAAACSASGTVSDQVSAYLGPYRRKGYEPNFYRVAHSENGHEMIGATLWQRPDLYFRSSSVFNADKVVTPLLLMHNEADNQTDWGQSFELFTALARLGKPVWLLQYDGEGHQLSKPEDEKDFTIRLLQFFDHYLKGAPPPKWMAEGIPAKMKGIDQGYELEPGKKLF